MASKHQMTRAKMDREQAVRERRARKQQKKDERKQGTGALGPTYSDTPAAQDLLEGRPEG